VAGALARLGVADHLAGGPADAAELAPMVGVPAATLLRLLRAAATVGLLDEPRPGTFALTPLGQPLRTGVPGSLRNYAVTLTDPAHWLPWGRLAHAVRSGSGQAEATLGAAFFHHFRAHPEEGATFAATMSELSALVAADVVARTDFSGARRIVDVGGSEGTLLAAVLAAHPTATGVLFDLPEVAARAGPALERAGVADRCEVVGGDFFDAVPAGGDAYLLKYILHDWPDDDARRILRRCREAMGPGSRLVVVEWLLPEPGQRGRTHLIDLNMLVLLGARERTLPELANLLASAGLHLDGSVPLEADPEMAVLLASPSS
jgi:SAM-dependent methyltransferase